MSNPLFHATVRDGRPHLDSKASFDRYMTTFKEGQRVTITCKKFKKQGTDPQRKYYFGVIVKMISREIGMNIDETHDSMKLEHASEKQESGLVKVESYSKMSTERREEYHEDVKRWAAGFLGMYIPDPNEVEA